MSIDKKLEISDMIALINGRVSASINKHLNRRFKSVGVPITTEQWSILACLWNDDMQTQQFICEYTCKDKASMTRLIDSLEKNGYVVRLSDPNDRRSNIIHLTEKGYELEGVVNSIISESIELATKDVNKEEFLSMINLFKKIVLNIESDNN